MSNNDKGKKKTTVKNPLERDIEQKARIRALSEMKKSEDQTVEKPSFLNKTRQEFTIFSRIDHQENQEIPQQIEMLAAEIKQEVAIIKKSNKDLITEIEEIEKQSLSKTEKQGIYHVRFLESILSYLRNIGAKIKEGRTWAAALTSKKAKRGSLFVARSKKRGTQYSLSQELQSARSVM